MELLAGQALFEVTKDASRPFVVSSQNKRIRAVGTQFDVNQRQGGTIVTVVEGTVAISSVAIQAEAPVQRVALVTAGEQAVLASGDFAPEPKPADLVPRPHGPNAG